MTPSIPIKVYYYYYLTGSNFKSNTYINPKNPFKKDELTIDYDKDSEEEYLEENAEDLISNDTSEENEEDEEEEGKWMVPDGYLSKDEASQEIIENKIENKGKSIMDIIEVRKNYNKPICLSFNNNMDNKHFEMFSSLKCRIYNTKIETNSFPIRVTEQNDSKSKFRYNKSIDTNLESLVKLIHYSQMNKDDIINTITEKYDIPKRALSIFLRDEAIIYRCENSNKVFSLNY